jgi:hypothetical protein
VSNGGQLVSTSGARRVGAGESLADVLDRVLDKGVVIAGDISIALVGVELLTIKIRLLIASADKAREMGIDWWRNDPFLTGEEKDDDRKLLDRIQRLEAQIASNGPEEKKNRGTARRTKRARD